jgi:hypothetical protein
MNYVRIQSPLHTHTIEGRDPFGPWKNRCLKTKKKIFIAYTCLIFNHFKNEPYYYCFTNSILHYITFMDIILTKIWKFLSSWYHNTAMFIVTHFIATCFQEIMVSARWRCRNNSVLTCRSYVKHCCVNYRIEQLLVLRELCTNTSHL